MSERSASGQWRTFVKASVIYSERRENSDYRGEKMIMVSAKIKKLWRVKVSGGESSHFVRHILGVFS